MLSRRSLLLLSVAVLLLAGGAAAFLLRGGSAGRLTAAPDVLDFGLVAHGDEPTLSLRVTNEGPRGVMLTTAHPSCACLVVDPSYQKSLMPGERTEIRVTLASGLVPPQKLERKYLEVRSSDPRMPVLMVPLRGEIVQRVRVEPAIVRVGPEDAAGRGEPKRIRVRAATGFTAKVLGVELTQPEWFSYEAKAAEGGGIDVFLHVKPDPARRGAVQSMLRLQVEAQGPSGPPITYPLVVSIQGSW
jgi:hypothetical protein